MEENKENLESPDSMTEEDRKIVDVLGDLDIQKIDSWLLEIIGFRWVKVAIVVSVAIEKSDREQVYLDIPDLFFAERIYHYCDIGNLELRGDKTRMRYSEVRRVYQHISY